MVAIVGATSTSAQTDASCPDMAKAVQDLMRHDARMRDWAQLGRYRSANAELAQRGAKVDVAFLGDSITDGWDDAPDRGFFPGKNYLNRGISGQTTPQMLIRLKPDVLAFKPRVLVLLAGTNDIAGNTGPTTNEEIQNNLTAIAELASSQGVRLVLASILPVSNYHVQPGTVPQTERRPLERINALNAWLREYARAHKHVYLDYFAAMVDAKGMLKAELSEDDLHPNVKGYAVMTPLAEAAIAEVMK
jgi:lysophospholipase L1-like esterase